jgi:ribosomal protein S18 acetylase RimI-like enzyme
VIALAPRRPDDDLTGIVGSNEDYWQLSGDSGLDLGADEVALVARDGDRIVGYAQLLPRHPTDGHPWIGLLLIDGRVRRRGYGRAVAEALAQRMREAGATAVRLGVLEDNDAALRFWAALGYRIVDKRPDLAKGRATVVMEKTL